jgi:hypothetical protein
MLILRSVLSTITVMVITYIDLAQLFPSLVAKFMDTLINLKNTNITISETPIAHALNRNLMIILAANSPLLRMHLYHLNEHLISSLLSATSIKYSLYTTNVLIGAVNHGLYYEKYSYDAAKHEILGACLQLFISRSYFHGQHGFDATDILNVLEVLVL